MQRKKNSKLKTKSTYHLLVSVAQKDEVNISFTCERGRILKTRSTYHLLVRVAQEQLKKETDWVAVEATAFASIVFPVPGGPYNKTPRSGLRIPVVVKYLI